METAFVGFIAILFFILILAIFIDAYKSFFGNEYHYFEDGSKHLIKKHRLLREYINIKSKINFSKDWVKEHPKRFFWFFFLFFLGGLLLINLLWKGNLCEFRDNLFSEAHGLLFDLIVFGILWAIYDESRKKRESLQNYRNELGDHRSSKTPEAASKVAGIIRRLNQEHKWTIIDLTEYFLEKANLTMLDLSGSYLYGTNLKGANLRGTKFKDAYFDDDVLLDDAIVDRHDWFEWLKNEIHSSVKNMVNELETLYRIERVELSNNFIIKRKSVYEDRGILSM